MPTSDLLMFASAIVGFGAIAGLIAGLFGVGGGVITVPLLYTLFRMSGVAPDSAIHIAIGTSLLTIVPTSLASLRTHAEHKAVDPAIVKVWALPVVLGAILGALIANHLSGPALSLMFGVFVFFIAGVMGLTPSSGEAGRPRTRKLPQRAIAFGIGTISALVGVGGGSLSVPTLLVCRTSIYKAIGTASAIGLMISLPAAIVFMFSKPHSVGFRIAPEILPVGTFGSVDFLAFCLLAPITIMTAPLGAKLAHRLPAKTLRRGFALLLALIAVKMIVTGWR